MIGTKLDDLKDTDIRYKLWVNLMQEPNFNKFYTDLSGLDKTVWVFPMRCVDQTTLEITDVMDGYLYKISNKYYIVVEGSLIAPSRYSSTLHYKSILLNIFTDSLYKPMCNREDRPWLYLKATPFVLGDYEMDYFDHLSNEMEAVCRVDNKLNLMVDAVEKAESEQDYCIECVKLFKYFVNNYSSQTDRKTFESILQLSLYYLLADIDYKYSARINYFFHQQFSLDNSYYFCDLHRHPKLNYYIYCRKNVG